MFLDYVTAVSLVAMVASVTVAVVEALKYHDPFGGWRV